MNILWLSVKYPFRVILTVGIGLLMITAMLTSCKNDIETIRSLDYTDTVPGLTAKDIKIIYSENAKMQMKLESPLLVNQEKDGPVLIFPEGFIVFFYDSLMNLQSTITADYGISFEKTKIMEARHNVVVENLEKGERLNTEELFWDRGKEIIYSDKFVKISTDEQVITGDGLFSRQPFNEIEIRNPKGLIEIKEEPE